MTERYVYDGNQIILTFDGSGDLTSRALFGPGIDQILAEDRIDGMSVDVIWAFADHLGTIRDLTSTAGGVLNHISYDSFGQITAETNATMNFRYAFTGRELDRETGDQHHRERQYRPRTGTWLGEDPDRWDAGDVNLYRVVGNGPLNKHDRFGLREADDRESQPKNKKLVDVHMKFEEHVNKVIQDEFAKLASNATAVNFLAKVYAALGEDAPGSGIDVKVLGSISQVAKAGLWLDTNLDESKNEIAKLTFKESRYGKSYVGNMRRQVWWLWSQKTADHGIAPTVRMHGTLMGTDKWEHFFQQGYWYWYLTHVTGDLAKKQQDRDFFGAFMEGASSDVKVQPANSGYTTYYFSDKSQTKYIKMAQTFNKAFNKMGYFGYFSTGIVSYADMNANEEGYQFYSKLSQAFEQGQVKRFTFQVKDYKYESFNEQKVKNLFKACGDLIVD